MLTYRDILRREFEKRRSANVHYSMRAFARDLDIAPSRLSEVLNSRRGISQEKGEAIARRLRYSKTLREYFITSIGAEHGRSTQKRDQCRARLETMPPIGTDLTDKLEQSYNIVAWYYGALMELPRVIRQGLTTKRAATLLGISHFQIESATRYLKRLGFWTEAQKPGPERQLSSSGLPKRTLRLNPAQVLKLAEANIPADPEGAWDYQATCFALSEQDLVHAEDILRHASRELYALAETSSQPNAVYLYASHFFKLTKGDNHER